jgi:hypothetical protein
MDVAEKLCEVLNVQLNAKLDVAEAERDVQNASKNTELDGGEERLGQP